MGFKKRLFIGLAFLGLILAIFQTVTLFANAEISDFDVRAQSDHILVYWETASELDSLGFHIWRGETNLLNNANRITANIIPSQVGGQPIGAEYEYEDTTAERGITYYYLLEAVDVNLSSDFYGPEKARLGDNYLPLMLRP